jgi:hypothetical protein
MLTTTQMINAIGGINERIVVRINAPPLKTRQPRKMDAAHVATTATDMVDPMRAGEKPSGNTPGVSDAIHVNVTRTRKNTDIFCQRCAVAIALSCAGRNGGFI